MALSITEKWKKNEEIRKLLQYAMAVDVSEKWYFIMQGYEILKKTWKLSKDIENPKTNEIFIDTWNFGVTTFFVKLLKRVEDDWEIHSFLYVIGENCENEQEALFLLLADLAELHNLK